MLYRLIRSKYTKLNPAFLVKWRNCEKVEVSLTVFQLNKQFLPALKALSLQIKTFINPG